jgi:hypothetical protein
LILQSTRVDRAINKEAPAELVVGPVLEELGECGKT